MRAIFLPLALSLLTGCASIVSESKYPVNIVTYPAGAQVDIHDRNGVAIYTGTTPALVNLDSGDGYFGRAAYTIDLKKEGFVPAQAHLRASMNGWYWGNIFFGGLIGMLIVDPLTGAMYKLPTSSISQLDALPPPPVTPMPAAGTAIPASKTEEIRDLQQSNLPYEEYQRRYETIQAK
ncbi:hypothetical protein [Pseudomonas sp. RIT-PI-AD]|uniref:hypothetical protein n=1 Tax=Pseudomonas sp. RIT-PI-AD TaxID=3035294 RepID=UPI0021D9C769|nr:hypothetical protein [Pseudomonas sp. RIT-PI-AD]